MNQFIASTTKHSAFTENGALAHASTGSVLADQFGLAGSQRARDIRTVFAEQSHLDASIGSEMALRFVFYLRAITRKPKGLLFIGEEVMKGQGNKDESFKRYLWYAVNKPELFYNNLWLFAVVGSYKDLWELAYLASENNIAIKEKLIFEVYQSVLNEKQVDDLAVKYLPQIVSNSKATTARSKVRNKLAKGFASYLVLNARTYRQLKTTGKAHGWQQDISRGLFNKIDFGRISGKALTNLVSSKFLKNQNLVSRYEEWISAQPIAKFTGYVYELYSKVSYNMPYYQKLTFDKQFEGLIELAKKDTGAIKGNVWCALDTSGSMDTEVAGKVKAIDICISLGIFFSTLNEGAFHKHVIMFDSTSEVKQLSGSFTNMVGQVRKNAMGSTNFQSVIDEIVRIKRYYPNVPLKDFPQTLLVVSDMQFNPADNGYSYYNAQKVSGASVNTNHEAAMNKLRAVFPSNWVDKFKVIWWDCTGRVSDVKQSTIEDGGTYVFSGFDGSVVSLLLGEKTKNEKKSLSMEEMIHEALSQEVLLQVKV